MSCICKWEYVDRPYTSARNYFLTKEFFDKVQKVCWSELIQFMNESPRPKRGEAPKFATDVLRSPVLEPALKAAAKQNKLVLFIAMTGG